MRVSILINNRNYGRFLSQAINSALAQSYSAVEVIVCDDDSTDDSWSIIERYGSRITALRNETNLGQAEAMNRAFAASQGELVLFLDSDDVLEPDAVQTCVLLFGPGVAKVQYPLTCIDGDGRPTGRSIPFLMHEGDVRPIIERFGCYAGPPSSGNCYRRSAIQRYFPLCAADWRRAADTPPFILAPFHGRVVNAPRPLGRYRLHSAANRARGCFGNIAARHADNLRVDLHRRVKALEILALHGGGKLDGPFLPAPWHLRSRAMSWRLENEQHPYPEDTAWTLWRMQARALQECPGYTWIERAATQTWLTALLVMPRQWAGLLATTNTSTWLRRWVGRVSGRAA